MPTKRHMHGGISHEALLLCMAFLLFGPIMAASARNLPAPATLVAGAVTSSIETRVTVTTSSDAVDGDTSSLGALNSQPGPDGAISLREAVIATNSTTNTAALTIAFNIPSSDPGHDSANGIWTIALGEQALPDLTHGNVTIDGSSQPGSPSHPQIVLDGYLVYEDGGKNNGFTITSSRNTIRGLTLTNFYDHGVLITGPNAANNQVVGCYLGPSADGGAANQPSSFGVELNGGAHNNIVGGADVATRNLIAGNEHSGVLIQGSNSHHNTIAGNWIGVTTNGQAALKNAVAGIMIEGGAHDNQIGGAQQGNLISGNDTGIYLDGGIATTIAGNIIGLAADGHTQLGNTNGGILMVRGAQNNVIGGINAEMRNVIAGNGTSVSAFGQGIYLSDLNTVNNTIQGNYIGVDSSGNLPAGNYRQGILVGVGAQGNIIGGTGAGEGNVIAYNGLGGIRIDAPDNQVAGNLIGVGANRTTQIGNQYNGVRVVGNNNTIGPGNLIAYNQQSGILISGSATTVLSNTLKSNARSGICVAGPNNTVQGNRIESNGDGAGPWSECPVRGGIVITSTNGTLVSDNDILSNNEAGVTVYGGSGNSILTNSISGNRTAGILLKSGGNNGLTPPHLDAVTNTMVSGTACPLCLVEVFIDDSDEGKVFLGATNAANDGTFSRSISPAAAPGEHYTATHTDSNGNTSSFAPAVSVPAPPGPPTPTPTPGTPPPRTPVLPKRQYVPIVRF